MGSRHRHGPPVRMILVVPLLLASTLLLAGWNGVVAAAQGKQTPPTGESAEWEALVSSFLESYFKAHPTVAVSAGRHEYDGQLPDWSREGIDREVVRLREQRRRAQSFAAETLSRAQQFERDYMLAVIDEQLFWHDTVKWPFRNPMFYSGSLDPNVYVAREYAPLEDRMRAFIRYARNIPKAAEQIRANLQTPLPRTYVEIGRITFGGLAEYYQKDVPEVFAPVRSQELQRELEEALGPATRAMRDLDGWLAAEEKRATGGYALGPEHFREMLRMTERVDTPLEELRRVGEQDLERNRQALERACSRMAPGKPVSACIQQVEAEKPEGGPVQAARTQLQELRRFLQEKELVSIPGKEQAAVEEAPPYQRWNFAYIDIPGPYEVGLKSIYYIAPPDPSWSKEEQLQYIPSGPNLLFTSVHEVWPGHFLQFLHANRAKSTFGQVFVGYAFAEGWAHYAEEMMWDAGLGEGDPRIHIGQLANALLRNCRYLSALRLHTGGMTVEESEKLFQDQCYQDPATARQQARRGTFDPAYLNYTMGKLMIMKLREDWTRNKGGQKAWKEFHDRLLAYGGPPIPLVRRAMLADREATSDALFPQTSKP